MIDRKLNEAGIAEFAGYVDDLRAGGKQNIPSYLLTSPDTSEELGFSLNLSEQDFESRYELGLHLVEALADIDQQLFIGDTGFWSGLALVWFNQLCPLKSDGTRKVSMGYNYVLSEDYKHRPRHALFTTWQLVNQYGDNSRFLLSREVSVRGELIEQLMARQYFLSCKGLIEAASKLYYDPNTHSFKRGATGRKSAGCVYRFVSWLQQLEVNYDLFSMSCDDFLTLMPAEFDRFKEC